MKKFNLNPVRILKGKLNNANDRDAFVIIQLGLLERNCLLLDAGCGSQRYREYCAHLDYRGQDFGQYILDSKEMLGARSGGVGGADGYEYGQLDYVGDIWNITEKDQTFDAILCTEVLEHIPYPNETIREFFRLLKPGGKLILTAPSNCLRHMDPYFFYSGFSDRWYQKMLVDGGFEINELLPVGDYYSWMATEIARTASIKSPFHWIILAPAFFFFFLQKKTQKSTDTLCSGYHVVATAR